MNNTCDILNDSKSLAKELMLGGKKWEIPMLCARQNRVVDPLILGLLPLFATWQQDKTTALGMLSQPQYEALQEIAFQGISRGRPDVSRDAFLDLPVTLPELVTAFAVVAEQTAIFSRGDPGEA